MLALYSDGPFSNSHKFISQVTLFFLFDPINGSNWIVCYMHVIHIILRFKYFGIFTTSTCYSQYNIFVNLSKKCINFIGWTTENVWQLNSFGNIKMKQVYVVCKSLKKIQEEKNIPLPYPWISVRKLSVPRCPSINWPKPPTSRSFSSCPSYVWSDKSISSPRCTPFGILYETNPSGIYKIKRISLSGRCSYFKKKSLEKEIYSDKFITKKHKIICSQSVFFLVKEISVLFSIEHSLQTV